MYLLYITGHIFRNFEISNAPQPYSWETITFCFQFPANLHFLVAFQLVTPNLEQCSFQGKLGSSWLWLKGFNLRPLLSFAHLCMLCCLSIIQELPQDSCSHLFTKMPREIVYLPPVGSWKRLKIHCGFSKTLTLRRSLPSKQSSKKQKAEKELSKTSFSWLISLFKSRGQSRCLAPGIHK